MRTLVTILVIVAVVVLGAWAIGLVDFGMSGGEAPQVEVEGGETPEVSATTGSIEINEAPDAQPEAEAAEEAQEEAAEEAQEEQN